MLFPQFFKYSVVFYLVHQKMFVSNYDRLSSIKLTERFIPQKDGERASSAEKLLSTFIENGDMKYSEAFSSFSGDNMKYIFPAPGSTLVKFII